MFTRLTTLMIRFLLQVRILRVQATKGVLIYYNYKRGYASTRFKCYKRNEGGMAA
jgi:hypothetical protein